MAKADPNKMCRETKIMCVMCKSRCHGCGIGNKEEGDEGLRQEVAKLRNDLCSDESDMYPMNACPLHGKAIVIVNDKFTPNPARCGALSL